MMKFANAIAGVLVLSYAANAQGQQNFSNGANFRAWPNFGQNRRWGAPLPFQPGTVASYAGTTLTTAGVTYIFPKDGYKFSGSGIDPIPASAVYMHPDPNGPDTILFGCPGWTFKTPQQSMEVEIRFQVKGANVTFGWQHEASVTGDAKICESTIVDSNPQAVSTSFAAADQVYDRDKLQWFDNAPHNVVVKISMSSGTNGTAYLRSYGTHFKVKDPANPTGPDANGQNNPSNNRNWRNHQSQNQQNFQGNGSQNNWRNGGGRRFAQQQPGGQLASGANVYRDLIYVPGSSNPAQSLDLYLPASDAAQLLPLIVWIHGGGWANGSKQYGPFQPFSHSGYAIASINYRLTGEAIFPAQIYDCKAAIRWLRANAQQYGIDANRIGVWGGSAGGHLAALVGTSQGQKSLEGDEGNLQFSSNVKAVADWFGNANLVETIQRHRVIANSPSSPDSRPMGKGGVLGLVSSLEQARAASPVTYVSKDSPPFLIVHGDQDEIVPVTQSKEFYERLKAVGAPVSLEVIHGAGHGLKGFEDQANDLTLKFFDQYLK